MNILAIYVNSIIQAFESFLRREVELVEDGIKLVLDEKPITYQLTPCIYTFKDLSEALFEILQSEYPGPRNVFVNIFNVITMKTKLVVMDGTIAIRFDEKSFFTNILCFRHGSDSKHYNEIISHETVNASTTNKPHLT